MNTRTVPLLCLLLAPQALFAAAPQGFYDGVAGQAGADLRLSLHDLVDQHTVIPYDASGFDVHDAIDLLDEVPGDPARVKLVYADAQAEKASWPAYNREHLWPQSVGAAEGSPAHSDLHHILACDANVNSARNNSAFAECDEGCAVHPEAPAAAYDGDTFEPPPWQKGDIARALFYMDVRYEGGADPDLKLGSDTSVASGCDCMGDLATLLAWHFADPVDGVEMARNDGVFTFQGNRNPFVDRPDFVCAVYAGGPCGPQEDVKEEDPVDGSLVWINEIHYDNEATDLYEGVEIAGPAGLDLSGYVLSLYNGAGGTVYETVALSGRIPDEGLGFGAVWFDIPGMQNGAPDGMALSAPNGVVLEGISYEGALAATAGPAVGTTLRDIGVAEDSLTPLGHSLQKMGEVPLIEDFAWEVPRPGSPGLLNDGQFVYVPPTPVPTPTPTESPDPTPSFEPGTGDPVGGPTPTPEDDRPHPVGDHLPLGCDSGAGAGPSALGALLLGVIALRRRRS